MTLSPTGLAIARVAVLLLVQLAVLNHVPLPGPSWAWVWPLGLLYLPLGLSRPASYGLALALGLVVDLYPGPLGGHAFMAVLLVRLRPAYARLLSPQIVQDDPEALDLEKPGLGWQLSYALPPLALYALGYTLLTHLALDAAAWGQGLRNALGTVAVGAVVVALFTRKR